MKGRIPIKGELDKAKEELGELEEQNKKVKTLHDELSAELSALGTRRDVAKRSYMDEKQRLLSEIERHPPSLLC